MRKFCNITLFAIAFLTFASAAQAQLPINGQRDIDRKYEEIRRNSEGDRRSGIQPPDLPTLSSARNSDANDLEARKRQQRITQETRQLNDASEQLLLFVKAQGQKDYKAIAKLADKITKQSRRLRQEYNYNDKEKAQPAAAAGFSDRNAELVKLAEKISELAKKLITDDPDDRYTLDVMNLNYTSNQLKEIESSALSVRAIAK